MSGKWKSSSRNKCSNQFHATEGFVGKGPLQNATVFLDLDDDGVKDANEPSVKTNSDGFFTITTNYSNYSIVALTDGSTVDTSSGNVLDGIILKADKNSTMVSPTTTLMKESGYGGVIDIITVLGLPSDFNPNTFNPYGAGADASLALSIEKANHKIISTINTFSGALEGSGATSTDSFKSAIKAFVEVVKDKKTHQAH